MNESAKRRQDLLSQMRNSKNIHPIPPVHPKYHTAYHNLHSERDNEQYNGSFLFRFVISVICFLCYVWMDTSDTESLKTNSTEIAAQIESTTNFEEIQEVWKEL